MGTITFRGLGWQKPGWYFNARSTGWVGPYKSKASAQKAMRAELDVQTRALSGDWGGTRGVSFRVYINGQTPYVAARPGRDHGEHDFWRSARSRRWTSR